MAIANTTTTNQRVRFRETYVIGRSGAVGFTAALPGSELTDSLVDAIDHRIRRRRAGRDAHYAGVEEPLQTKIRL
jgi:hypothetical protein